MITKTVTIACALIAIAMLPAHADGSGKIRPLGESTFPGVPASVAAGIQQNPPAPPALKPLQQTFTVQPGGMLRATLSRDFLNRIVTPFANPVVRTTSPVKVEAVGQSLFVSIAHTQMEPIVIYVMDQSDNLNTISLMLDAKEVGPVEIDLQESGVAGAVQGVKYKFDGERASQFERAAPHDESITNTMRLIAQGKVPPGYSFRAYQAGDAMPGCSQGGVSISPRQVMEGQDKIAYVGVLTNTTNSPIEFQESTCGAQGVAAVASWPGPLLQPHTSSEIYIIVRKSNPQIVRDARPTALAGGMQ